MSASARLDRRKITVLIGVLLGMMLGALDQTVVGTAMPRIIATLGGMNFYTWVVTAYLLTSTAAVPIFGKLSDIYGRRPFYLAGIAVFLLGSVLSGLSQNITELIAFRALQGIGGGIMMGNSGAIIGDIFPPAERGRWQGILGAAFGLASIIGPGLGGWLTDNWSWHWVFYVNVPVGLLAFAVIFAAMPSVRSHEVKRTVDYWGVAALLVGLVPLLLALSFGGIEYPWRSPQIYALFSVAAAGTALFVLVESRAPEPLLPLGLFRNSIFLVTAIIVFLTGFGMFGAILFIPVFMQGVIGITATNSGLLLMPLMLANIIASTIAGQIISRTGRYRILGIVGLVLVVGGMALLATLTTATTESALMWHMILLGIGLGITMPVFIISVQNALPYKMLGVVTSSVQFFRSIGGTVGVAIMGTVMFNTLQSQITAHLPTHLSAAASAFASKLNAQALLDPQALVDIQRSIPVQMAPMLAQFLDILKQALATSIARVFGLSTVVVTIALVASFFLREVPLRKVNVLEEEPLAMMAETGTVPWDEAEPGAAGGTGEATYQDTSLSGDPAHTER